MTKARKGSIKSIAIIIVAGLLPLFIVSVVSHAFVTEISQFQIPGIDQPDTIIDTVLHTISLMDIIIILAYAVLMGRVIIRSFRLNIHPIFGIVGVLSLPIVVYLVAFGSNLLGVLEDIEMLQPSLNEFSFSWTFFTNSPLIAAASSVIVLFIMIGGVRIARNR